MGLKNNDNYFKINGVRFIETDINGVDEVHIHVTLELYDYRGGQLQAKSEQLYIVNAEDFDKDGDIIAQVYEIAKVNNMYDLEDVLE